eukprot:gene263-1770_t
MEEITDEKGSTASLDCTELSSMPSNHRSVVRKAGDQSESDESCDIIQQALHVRQRMRRRAKRAPLEKKRKREIE